MRRVADVPICVVKELNLGKLETKNLMEGFAIDMQKLADAIGLGSLNIPEGGIVKKMQTIGEQLPDWRNFANHPSDTVRGWAAYGLSSDKSLSFRDKIAEIRLFAADSHFQVREWAWLAIRPDIICHLKETIRIMETWVYEPCPRIRRFVSESTRPRGVWSAHIIELKRNPGLARTLLDPLKDDPSEYVQNSVGNWLNDAAKSTPTWVETVCARWQKKSQSRNTQRIVKRALRSID